MSRALARRAVACKGWRWMPGMRLVIRASEYAAPTCYRLIGDSPSASVLSSGPVADLSDPATLGCLLALVREAWGWPNAFLCHDEIGWCVPSGEVGCCVELQDEAGDGERYATEEEALVAALEGAP